jgi:hypothetical protein
MRGDDSVCGQVLSGQGESQEAANLVLVGLGIRFSDVVSCRVRLFHLCFVDLLCVSRAHSCAHVRT